MERHQKLPGGGGVLQAKILEPKYEVKLEFPGRRGMQSKTTFRGVSMDIFWNVLHIQLTPIQIKFIRQ